MDLEAQIAAINAKYAPLLVNAGNEEEPGEAKRQVNAQKDAEILAVRNAAAAASSDTTGDDTYTSPGGHPSRHPLLINFNLPNLVQVFLTLIDSKPT